MLEHKSLWAALDSTPNEWVETTERMYESMLDAVFPAAIKPGRFLMGEPLKESDNGELIYTCFVQKRGGYYAKNMTIKEFEGV